MNQKRFMNPLYLVYLVGAVVGLVAVYAWFAPGTQANRSARVDGELAILPPKAIPTPPAVLRSPQGAGRLRVGIVAGHAGFDSGAVCPDGLTEASINLAISELVVAGLRDSGVPADLLDEFDDRLEGYVASALVSIHADSCIYPGKSGFKVTSLEGSQNPENQLLVDCLVSAYTAQTGLAFDPFTITYDMTQYHAFNSISASTPGAIIETGFMLDDRDLLTNQRQRVAQGIVDGIHCFLLARRNAQ